ncbi:Ger(x)C family spore germination protein [Paenibacillus sp. sgz302251]|uniref:Ger(x)C family spore germination protein n=1 Tax=Paenibacillus sp. sgz302251 TaxID=3414493 RepID=UPI003C7A4732
MKRCFLLLICAVFTLSACTNQRIIDKIQIIQSLGYDMQDHKYLGTLIYPSFEEKGKVKLHVHETESDSYEDIIPRMNTKSAFVIEIGKLSTILFGKTFAESGIDHVLETFSRDPRTSSRLQLGICETTAKTILQSSKNVNIPFHITNKIEQNIKLGNLPKTNLHLFLMNYYNEGSDPYMPYFIMEKNEVKIDGLAIFKKDKYVTHINMNQSFLFKILVDETKNGSYQFKPAGGNERDFISLRNLKANVKYTVKQIKPVPELSIHLDLTAQLLDVPTNIPIAKNKDYRIVEKIVEEHFNKEIQQLISRFRKLKVDPLGIGIIMKAKSKEWSKEDFLHNYPHLKTAVSSHVTITQSGIAE